ncbi:MAG: hypothetical protein KJP25_07605, partial [Gammaproteobacteria bacterium]|nr:hypothetical protein [Gammaproteobacteria bacterium]
APTPSRSRQPDKHAKELSALKAAHDKHAQGLEESGDRHASVDERIKYLEKLLGDSADKHARELKAEPSPAQLSPAQPSSQPFAGHLC